MHATTTAAPPHLALVALEVALRAAGQHHLLEPLLGLPDPQRAQRLAPLLGVPVDRLARAVEQLLRSPEGPPAAIRPIPWVPLPRTPDELRARETARAAGEALLREGRVATLLVAGGLGTRLGWNAPKGTFAIGPVTDRTLFQHFAELHTALERRHGAKIPWAVQTSAANHEATQDFFEENRWFGRDPADIRLFPQGDLPAFDLEGRIVLDAAGSPVVQPDGHGGVFPALHRHGVLDWLSARGVEHVFYFQVDNPLVPLCDPAFLGMHAARGSEMSTFAVRKEDPAERVGVLALRDGVPGIVEYTELSPALAEERSPDGALALCAGNTAIHAFTLGLLRRTAAEARFPIHAARKPIPRGDAPPLPGVKLEYFVFDALPYAERTLVMELDRATGFAPVKNASGQDSPDTARAMLRAVWRGWLEQWDPRLATLGPDAPVEVSPLVALDAAELSRRPIPAEPLAAPIVLR